MTHEPKETWEKTRGPGTSLTEDEKRLVRQAYREGLPARDVAQALKCATRTVQKYYKKLSESTNSRRRYRQAPDSPPVGPRFYHSTFEPS